MRGVIGLDIGGVNTKAVWRDGDERRTVPRPYDVVRDRERADGASCATSSPGWPASRPSSWR